MISNENETLMAAIEALRGLERYYRVRMAPEKIKVPSEIKKPEPEKKSPEEKKEPSAPEPLRWPDFGSSYQAHNKNADGSGESQVRVAIESVDVPGLRYFGVRRNAIVDYQNAKTHSIELTEPYTGTAPLQTSKATLKVRPGKIGPMAKDNWLQLEFPKVMRL